MRNAMLINEKDNVIVAIEPLSKGTKAVYQVNGRPEEVKVLADARSLNMVSTSEKRSAIFQLDRMFIHIMF